MNWIEFLNQQYKVCGLCGNTGVIDTCNAVTPAGINAGGLHYCVCPNGRTLKKLRVNLEEHLSQLTVKQEKENFLVVCDSLRKLIKANAGQASLTKEDFVKEVRSLGWYWDEFEDLLREYRNLANNLIDTVYSRGI